MTKRDVLIDIVSELTGLSRKEIKYRFKKAIKNSRYPIPKGLDDKVTAFEAAELRKAARVNPEEVMQWLREGMKDTARRN